MRYKKLKCDTCKPNIYPFGSYLTLEKRIFYILKGLHCNIIFAYFTTEDIF